MCKCSIFYWRFMEDIGLGKGLKGILINKVFGFYGIDVIWLFVLLWVVCKL